MKHTIQDQLHNHVFLLDFFNRGGGRSVLPSVFSTLTAQRLLSPPMYTTLPSLLTAGSSYTALASCCGTEDAAVCVALLRRLAKRCHENNKEHLGDI